MADEYLGTEDKFPASSGAFSEDDLRRIQNNTDVANMYNYSSSVPKYLQKEINTVTSLEDKQKITQQTLFEKTLQLNNPNLRKATITGVVDGDTLDVVYPSTNGTPTNARVRVLTTAGRFDSPDNMKTMLSSPSKTQWQQQYAMKMYGLPDISSLTPEHMRNLDVYAQNAHVAALLGQNIDQFDPTKTYLPNVNGLNGKEIYINPIDNVKYNPDDKRITAEVYNTQGQDVGGTLARNPYTNADYDMFKVNDVKSVTKNRMIYDANSSPDFVTTSNMSSKDIEDLKNITRVANIQRMYNENADTDFIYGGELIDRIKSAANQSFGRVAYYFNKVIGNEPSAIDKALTNPDTANIVSDAMSGVKMSTRQADIDNLTQAHEAFDKGDYLTAAASYMKSVPGTLADSIPQMAMLGASAFGTPAALIGIGLAAADQHLMDRAEYSRNNNGKEMSALRSIADYVGNYALLGADAAILKPFFSGKAALKIIDTIANAQKNGTLRQVLTHMGLGFLFEATQEGSQQVFNTYMSQNQNNPKSVLDIAKSQDVIDATILGGMSGGVLGAAGGVHSSLAGKAAVKQQLQAKEALNSIQGNVGNDTNSNPTVTRLEQSEDKPRTGLFDSIKAVFNNTSTAASAIKDAVDTKAKETELRNAANTKENTNIPLFNKIAANQDRNTYISRLTPDVQQEIKTKGAQGIVDKLMQWNLDPQSTDDLANLYNVLQVINQENIVANGAEAVSQLDRERTNNMFITTLTDYASKFTGNKKALDKIFDDLRDKVDIDAEELAARIHAYGASLQVIGDDNATITGKESNVDELKDKVNYLYNEAVKRAQEEKHRGNTNYKYDANDFKNGTVTVHDDIANGIIGYKTEIKTINKLKERLAKTDNEQEQKYIKTYIAQQEAGIKNLYLNQVAKLEKIGSALATMVDENNDIHTIQGFSSISNTPHRFTLYKSHFVNSRGGYNVYTNLLQETEELEKVIDNLDQFKNSTKGFYDTFQVYKGKFKNAKTTIDLNIQALKGDTKAKATIRTKKEDARKHYYEHVDSGEYERILNTPEPKYKDVKTTVDNISKVEQEATDANMSPKVREELKVRLARLKEIQDKAYANELVQDKVRTELLTELDFEDSSDVKRQYNEYVVSKKGVNKIQKLLGNPLLGTEDTRIKELTQMLRIYRDLWYGVKYFMPNISNENKTKLHTKLQEVGDKLSEALNTLQNAPKPTIDITAKEKEKKTDIVNPTRNNTTSIDQDELNQFCTAATTYINRRGGNKPTDVAEAIIHKTSTEVLEYVIANENKVTGSNIKEIAKEELAKRNKTKVKTPKQESNIPNSEELPTDIYNEDASLSRDVVGQDEFGNPIYEFDISNTEVKTETPKDNVNTKEQPVEDITKEDSTEPEVEYITLTDEQAFNVDFKRIVTEGISDNIPKITVDAVFNNLSKYLRYYNNQLIEHYNNKEKLKELNDKIEAIREFRKSDTYKNYVNTIEKKLPILESIKYSNDKMNIFNWGDKFVDKFFNGDKSVHITNVAKEFNFGVHPTTTMPYKSNILDSNKKWKDIVISTFDTISLNPLNKSKQKYGVDIGKYFKTNSIPHIGLLYNVQGIKHVNGDENGKGRVAGTAEGFYRCIPNMDIIAAIDYSLRDFLSTQGKSLFSPYSDTEIKNAVGVSEDATIDISKTKTLLQKYGIPRSTIASTLGHHVLKVLGITSNENTQLRGLEQLATGIGLEAIDYGEQYGYFKKVRYNPLVDPALGRIYKNSMFTIKSAFNYSIADPIFNELQAFRDNTSSIVNKSDFEIVNEEGEDRLVRTTKKYTEKTESIRHTNNLIRLGEFSNDFMHNIENIDFEISDNIVSYLMSEPNLTDTEKESLIEQYGVLPRTNGSLLLFKAGFDYRVDQYMNAEAILETAEKMYKKNRDELTKQGLTKEVRKLDQEYTAFINSEKYSNTKAIRDRYKPENISYDELVHRAGKNKALKEQYDSLIKYYKYQTALCNLEKFTGFKFDWFTAKNNRIMIDNQDLNPQASKEIQRYIVTPTKGVKEIHLFDKDFMKAEAFAICQAFDILDVDEEIERKADIIRNLSRDKLVELLNKIFRATKSELKEWSKNKDNIGIEVGVENYSQILNTIDHLLRRRYAISKDNIDPVMDVNLLVETDGTTSGYGFKALLFADDYALDFIGNQVGIITKEGLAKINKKHQELHPGTPTLDFKDVSMHMLKKGKYIDDIYQTIAYESCNKAILSFKGKNKFMDAIKDSIDYSEKDERKEDAVYYTGLSIEGLWGTDVYGPLAQHFAKILPRIEEIKDKDGKVIGHKVSSELRNLFKPVVMVFGYSAGSESIRRQLAEATMELLVNEYMKLHVDFKEYVNSRGLASDYVEANITKVIDNCMETKTFKKYSAKEREHISSLLKLFMYYIPDAFNTYNNKVYDKLTPEQKEIYKTTPETLTTSSLYTQLLEKSANSIILGKNYNTENIVTNYYREHNSVYNKAYTLKVLQHKKLDEKLTEEFNSTTRKVNDTIAREQIKTLSDLFFDVMSPTYGRSAIEMLSDKFHYSILCNKTLNDANHILTNKIFIPRLKKAINRVIEEKGSITVGDYQKLLLSDELKYLLPTIPLPDDVGNGINTGVLTLFKQEKVRGKVDTDLHAINDQESYNDTDDNPKAKNKDPEYGLPIMSCGLQLSENTTKYTSVSVDPKTYKKEVHPNTVDWENTSIDYREFADPRLIAAVLSVHSSDAMTIKLTQESIKYILTVHDAIVGNCANAYQFSSEYCSNMAKVCGAFDPLDAMYTKLLNAAYLTDSMGIEIDYSENIKTIENFLDVFKEIVDTNKSLKDKLYKEGFYICNMDSITGAGAYIQTNPNNNYNAFDLINQKQNKHTITGEVHGADSSSSSLFDNEDAYTISDSIESEVDRLATYDSIEQTMISNGNTIDTEEHRKNLRNLVSLINPKALKNYVVTGLQHFYTTGIFNSGIHKILVTFDKHNSTTNIEQGYTLDEKTRECTLSLLTSTEVYAHELTHAGLMFGKNLAKLDNNSTAYNLIESMRDLYHKAIESDKITYEIFIPKDCNPDLYSYYEENAKKIYDYIFNNPHTETDDGFYEFVAYGLTYQPLIDALNTITVKPEPRYKAKLGDFLLGIAKKLYNFLFNRASIDKYYSQLDDTKKVYVGELLEQLFSDLQHIDTKYSKHDNPESLMGAAISSFSTIKNKLQEDIRFHISQYTGKYDNLVDAYKDIEKIYADDSRIAKAAKLCINARKSLRNNAARQYLKEYFSDTLSALNRYSHLNYMSKLYRDITATDSASHELEMLKLIISQVDSNSKGHEAALMSNILADFKDDKHSLSIQDKEALSRVILDTDLHTLYNDNIDEIKKILTNKEYRQSLINTYESTIENLVNVKHIPENRYIALMNQARGLANYMIHGVGLKVQYTNLDTMINAYVIKSDKVAIKDNLNKLITLYAINLVNPSDVNTVLKLEDAGIKSMLSAHSKVYTEDTVNSLYHIKGMHRSLYDTTRDVRLEPTDKEIEMAKEGYKKVKDINLADYKKLRIPNNYSIYVNNFVAPKRLDSVAFVLAGQEKLGEALLHATLSNEDASKYDPQTLANRISEFYNMDRHKIINFNTIEYRNKLLSQEDIENSNRDTSILVSNLSPTNTDRLDLTLALSKDIKKKYGYLIEDGIKSISKTYANIDTRAKANEMNQRTIDFLVADMKQNMTEQHTVKNPFDTSTLNKNRRYVSLQDFTTSKDKKVREYLESVKSSFTPELKGYLELNDLWVREEWLYDIFGTPSKSLTDLDIMKKVGPTAKKAVSVAEYITKTVAYGSKRNIVMLTPGVFLGNIISNLMLHIMRGRNPLTVFRYSIQNTKNVLQYMDDKKQYNRLLMKERIGTATQLEIKQKNFYDARMKANPIYELVSKGMYQSIVEDLNANDIEATSKFTRLVETNKMLNKLPSKYLNPLKVVIRNLYMTQGTPIFDMMYKATQMSDFIARCTEYQLQIDEMPKNLNNKEIKTYKKKVYKDVLDSFINYDRGQHPWEQYLNDMGLVMFSKFAKRIQPILTGQIFNRPIDSLGYLATQYGIHDFEDILEQNVFSKKWSALIHTPFENFMDTVIPVPLQYMFMNKQSGI